MRAPHNRWQAFLIHLGLSTVIFLVLLYFIVFHWYPYPFFATDGGWQGVRLITGVDLILGPMLTLIVYKVGKPGLKLDLALIGLVQAMALVWGTWLVHGERIALVSYANGSFYTLSPEQVREIGGKAEEISTSSGRSPPYSFVRLPDDPRERRALVMTGLFSGMLPYHHAERHEPYGAEHLPALLKESTDTERLSQDNPEFKSHLESLLRRHGDNAQDFAFFPAHSRYGKQMLVLRRKDGKLIGGIDLPSDFDTPTETASPPRP